MFKSHIISSIIVILFVVSAYFFLNEYTNLKTATQNLIVLKGQERFLKHRLADLNKKNKIIETVDKFVDQAKNMGLTKDRWDQFSVNLIDEPSSFLQCQKIIEQTTNSKYYYFKPEILHIKVSPDTNGPALVNSFAQENQSENADSISSPSDLIVNLKGLFFIRK